MNPEGKDERRRASREGVILKGNESGVDCLCLYIEASLARRPAPILLRTTGRPPPVHRDHSGTSGTSSQFPTFPDLSKRGIQISAI